jgi:WD40 repeat protein
MIRFFPAIILAFLSPLEYDYTAKVHSEDSPIKRVKLRPTDDGILGISFSPDGNWLAIATGEERSGSAAIYVSSIEKPDKYEFVGQANVPITNIRFLPDSKTIVSVGRHGECLLWDRELKKRIAELKGHSGRIACLAINSKGSLLATGDSEGKVRIWDLAKRKQLSLIEMKDGYIRDLSFHPSKNVLVIASDKSCLRFWDANSGEKLFDVKCSEYLMAAKFLADGNSLVSVEKTGSVLLWKINWNTKVATDRPLSELGSGCVPFVDISPDQKQAAIGYGDAVVLVSLSDAPVIRQIVLQSHHFPVSSVGFSPDGKLCTGSLLESHIWLWTAWPK